jgi:hypothetical protein
MGIRPASIPDGRYVDKTNLQVLGRSRPSDQGQHHTTQNHDDSPAHNIPPKELKIVKEFTAYSLLWGD